MKTSLLPIALLALSQPGAALAHPAEPLGGISSLAPLLAPAIGHGALNGLRAGVPGYGTLPYRTGLPQPRVMIGGLGIPGLGNGYATGQGQSYRNGYGYGSPLPGYGSPAPGYGQRPLPSVPYGSPDVTYDYFRGSTGPYGIAQVPPTAPRGCTANPTRVLIGAAIGGLTSATLAPNSRTRAWAVPMGAALGGLGGLATGC
jgi:hypothetical protein